MKKKLLLIIIPLILLLGGAAGASYYVYDNTVNIDTIYKGIKVEGFDVSGKNKEEAKEFLTSEVKERDKDKSMKLHGGDKDYTIDLEDVGFAYDFDKALDEAYALGRNKSAIQRYKEVKNIEKNGVDIPLETSYESSKVELLAKEISEELYQESKDSTFSFNGGNPSASESAEGREVDEDRLKTLIEENIYSLEDIEIPIETVEPKYTKEYYSKINGVIGEASTAYASSTAGRKANIRLSTKQFNGKILHPGESLSYNATVGGVTKSQGYQIASVIENGEFVEGVGGGICQTSTTMYNALLQADLTITERSPHSVPIAYVPKGTDAAVATGWKDLKFRNDFDFPIYINAFTSGDRVYFKVYGDKNVKNYQVKIESKVTNVIKHTVKENLKPNAAPGSRELVQTGRDGYKVVTYKYKIRNGKVFDSKQITSDYYREQTGIYNVGPAKSKEPAKPVTPEKPAETPEEPKDDPKEEKEDPKGEE